MGFTGIHLMMIQNPNILFVSNVILWHVIWGQKSEGKGHKSILQSIIKPDPFLEKF